MRKVNNWLERQPLWLYSPIMFALSFLTWTLAVYVGAWLAGGQITAWLTGGQITRGYLVVPDVPEDLMDAAILTVIFTAGHLWRKHRQTRQRTEA